MRARLLDRDGERKDRDQEDREHNEPSGHVLQAKKRVAQESLRALGAL